MNGSYATFPEYQRVGRLAAETWRNSGARTLGRLESLAASFASTYALTDYESARRAAWNALHDWEKTQCERVIGLAY